MKILIVEDSATLRHVMCLYITNAGHETVIAENGEQALQIFDTEKVDMVIMDIEMPGLNGLETTRIMRDWLSQEDVWIPIIFVTGKHEEDDLNAGIEAGGDDYLIKPVSETILTAKIRAMERIMDMRNELKRLNQSLVELSERDGLTHLYNRRTFDERALALWKQAAREGTPLTVLIMDIDHFKLFNDCYGHLAGDDCIKSVANALLAGLSRPIDLLARYGGEEFIVMLPNTHEEGAFHVAERLRTNVEKLKIPHKESDTSKFVTLSVGGSLILNTKDAQLKDQIHAADQALYASKLNGRNRSTVKLFNSKIRVLISEGSSNIMKLVDGQLDNYVVMLHARSSEETLDIAAQQRPDVIVLHDNLDQPGAWAVAKDLNEGCNTSHIPLVIISNESPPDHIDTEVHLTTDQSQYELATIINKMLF